MPRLPQSERDMMLASAVEARRLLESEDMKYQRPAVRQLLCVLVLGYERLLTTVGELRDLERRMDRLDGRHRAHFPGEDEEG